MRKYFSILIVLIMTMTLVRPSEVRAEMPVKAKAFLTIAGYGTAGGALLGAASMAFGTNSRAIAQGASLGLYAGILFGAYVLISHHQRRYGSYDDVSTPYSDSNDVYGDDYQSDEGGSQDSNGSSGGFFDRFEVMQEKYQLRAFTPDSSKKKGGQIPPIKINFFQYNF